jgi:transcriptional regulator with XRE-family HTH domain
MRGAIANGAQIRAARLSRGLTQEQLAVMAELDVKTVRKAERGKRLDLGPISRLAHALQIELSRLIRPAPSETEHQIRLREHVMRWQQVWDAHDSDAVVALYHDKAVLHLPGGPNIPFGGTFRGKEEIRRGNEAAWSTCRTAPAHPSEFSLTIADDTVFLQGVKGVYLPNGELVRLWCLQVFTFEGDLIADHRVEYDTLKFAQLLQFPTGEVLPGDRSESSP